MIYFHLLSSICIFLSFFTLKWAWRSRDIEESYLLECNRLYRLLWQRVQLPLVLWSESYSQGTIAFCHPVLPSLRSLELNWSSSKPSPSRVRHNDWLSVTIATGLSKVANQSSTISMAWSSSSYEEDKNAPLFLSECRTTGAFLGPEVTIIPAPPSHQLCRTESLV